MLVKILEKIVYGFSFGTGMGLSLVMLPRANFSTNNQCKNLDSQISYPYSDTEYKVVFNSK